MHNKQFQIILLFLIFSSCHWGNENEKIKPSSSDVSTGKSDGTAIDQTNPTIMVLPSDALLQKLSCITELENQGSISYKRDYQKSLINNSDLKFVIASIEELFANAGYPLENMEQQLKQIINEKSMDEMEDISKDPRTLLMNTVRPDYVIDIDYNYSQDPLSRNPKKILSYVLTAINTYTNKSIASITRTNLNTQEQTPLATIIKKDLTENISNFQTQIKSEFTNEISNGIEITLRLTTENNASFSFSDECLGTENYNDWLNNWLKKNTFRSSFKPVKNTDKELKYTNVKIKPKLENGQRYSAFDFANDLKKDFSKSCGIKAINRTQGIGDAYIVVSGLK